MSWRRFRNIQMPISASGNPPAERDTAALERTFAIPQSHWMACKRSLPPAHDRHPPSAIRGRVSGHVRALPHPAFSAEDWLGEISWEGAADCRSERRRLDRIEKATPGRKVNARAADSRTLEVIAASRLGEGSRTFSRRGRTRPAPPRDMTRRASSHEIGQVAFFGIRRQPGGPGLAGLVWSPSRS